MCQVCSVVSINFGTTASVWAYSLRYSLHSSSWLGPGCKCTSEESCRSLCSGISQHYPDPGLSLLYTNCRSVLSKMVNLRVLASSNRPYFIGLTETWLTVTFNRMKWPFLFIPPEMQGQIPPWWWYLPVY